MSNLKGQFIELNGIANIHMLVQMLETRYDGSMVGPETAKEDLDAIKVQLALLERYFLAYQDAVQTDGTIPKWHEVRENPSKYPTLRERFSTKEVANG